MYLDNYSETFKKIELFQKIKFFTKIKFLEILQSFKNYYKCKIIEHIHSDFVIELFLSTAFFSRSNTKILKH